MSRLLGAVLATPVLLAALALPSRGQSTARYGHTTTLLPNGNVLITGGYSTTLGQLDSVEMFISTAGTYQTVSTGWTTTLGTRSSHTATLLPDGRVFIAGGQGAAGVVASVRIYNPNTNTLTDPGNLAAARFNHTATLLPNGKVLIAGGANATGPLDPAATQTCELFNPTGGAFGTGVMESAGQLGLRRAGHTATLLPDGRVFVAGGYINLTANPADFAVSTELYEYVPNKWSPGPSLVAKRYAHSATVMGNGKVLISGGFNGKDDLANRGYLSTAEVYDPITDSILPAKSMQARKAFHSSTLMGDGKVQLYGGIGNITTTYVSFESQFVESPAMVPSILNILPTPKLATGSITGSNLYVRMKNVELSVPATGRIVHGEIRFSSPLATLSDAQVRFTDKTDPGTYAVLDGIDVEAGIIKEADVRLNGGNPTGEVLFWKQDMKSADGLANATIYLTDVAAGLPPGESRNIDPNGPSLITANISLTMPGYTVGAQVSSGTLRLIAGSVGNQTGGYNVILTSGSADLRAECSGSTVMPDEDGVNGVLACNGVTFREISGVVQSATSYTLACPACAPPSPHPLTFNNLYLQNISLQAHYVLSQLDLTEQPFTFDISTIVIKEMIFADSEQYDPSDNTWGFGATPGPAGARFNHSSALLPNADELIIGGRVCTNAGCPTTTYISTRSGFGYIYQQGEGGVETSWQQYQKQMIKRRRAHTANLLPNGQILVAGGSDGPVSLADTEVFDPVEETWSAAGSMAMGHSNHSATLLPNGTVLVAGGFKSQNSTGATNYSELYFPETRSWVKTGDMISSRSFHTAVLLPDGNVMVAGGFANGDYLNSAEIYITTSHRWIQLDPMNTKRAQHTMTALHTGKVVVAGGVNVSGVLGDESANTRCGVEIFDPSTGDWNYGTGCPPITMNSKRHSHTVTMLRDGRLLAAGGNDGFGEVAKAEIYDPTLYNPVTADPVVWSRTGDAPYPPGDDMIFPRISHTAQLLPNGKVLLVGGFDKFGKPVEYAEAFDVDLSTWQMQGKSFQKRGDHTCTLLADGTLVVAGGFDGVESLNITEHQYFTYSPDEATPIPFPRVPAIVDVSSGLFDRGGWITMTGNHFTGESEAAGGGAASGNSHHSHPRIYLQRMAESGNSGAKSAGFLIDLTSAAFYPGQNSWDRINSSITLALPTSPGLLPYGYYHLRVAANSQFSPSKLIQIGPARPSSAPGIPHGALVGVSSVCWSWPPVTSGTVDGYNVYFATSGVFISTVSPTQMKGGEVYFYQTGLAPDTPAEVKVAAYTLSGDGDVTFATESVKTATAKISGVTGSAKSVSSIEWSWSENPGAIYYKVYSTSAGVVIATPTSHIWLQEHLSTNTASCVRVQAVTEAGIGELTAPSTTYTLAAPPLAGSSPYSNIGTKSLSVKWSANTNPAYTTFEGFGGMVGGSTVPIVGAVTQVDLVFPEEGTRANALIEVYVRARNGYLDEAGVPSPEDNYVSLGATCTLANSPSSPTVTFVTPSSIGLEWETNGNSTWTVYQVTLSTDNFNKHVSTPIAFADNYSSSTVELNGLLTGAWYDIRVQASNLYGALTGISSTRTYTDNGGGPLGSIGVYVSQEKLTTLEGNVGNGRGVSLYIYPHTFTQDLFLYISSQTPSWNGNRCGSLPAVTLTARPDAQPVAPFNLGISYDGSGVATADLPTLSIVRYDPAGRTCVPLLTSIDRAGKMAYAQSNHLSTFQLMQILPQRDLENARIFPNPLYTSYQGYFTFDRLPASALVRVYTLHGEQIFDGRSGSTGLLTWNATNVVGRPVASGVYFAVIEAEGKKRIMKLAVVR
ncbi:MAG: kelch repeat-containing protein [Elusimicrobiota bacterium]